MDIVRKNSEGSVLLGRHFHPHQVRGDAETVIARLACAHETEVKMVKDVSEARIDVDGRQTELSHIAMQARSPYVWSKRKSPFRRGWRRYQIGSVCDTYLRAEKCNGENSCLQHSENPPAFLYPISPMADYDILATILGFFSGDRMHACLEQIIWRRIQGSKFPRLPPRH